MFLSRNKKNNAYPCKPQLYCIKVGFKGIKIIKAYFRDDLQSSQCDFNNLERDVKHQSIFIVSRQQIDEVAVMSQ